VGGSPTSTASSPRWTRSSSRCTGDSARWTSAWTASTHSSWRSPGHLISKQLRRIEATTTDESGRRAHLGRDLAALGERRVVLQARVAAIERLLGPW